MRDLSFKGRRQSGPNQRRRQHQRLNSETKITGNCFYCDKPGHMRRYCRQRAADEADKKRGLGRQRTIAFGGSSVAANIEDWVIDSGASKHLTPEKQHLYNYRNVAPNTSVIFVNGQEARAVGQGEVKLQVTTPSGTQQIKVKNVVHVPEATVSLFSTRNQEPGKERLEAPRSAFATTDA